MNRSALLLLALLAIVGLVPGAPRVHAFNEDEENIPGAGLEVADAHRLCVMIEGLTDDAKKLGLTKELLEARVLQKVRSAGITPVKEPLQAGDCFMYVNVNVVGVGFSVETEFCRPVLYRPATAPIARRALGRTWHIGATGTARDKQFILQAATEQAETFCNEYLKANGK